MAKGSKCMSNWRERRDALVKEYLQRNGGNVRETIRDLKEAYATLSTSAGPSETLAYLEARNELEGYLKSVKI